MPNWTSNQLIINGNKDKVNACREFIKGKGLIDFDKIIPTPSIIKNTAHGSRKFGEVVVNNWYVDNSISDYAERAKTERPFTSAELAELNKTGYSSWYDFCTAVWGTKWNASDVELFGESDGYVELHFATAWCAPEGIHNALVKKFPDLSIEWNYRNEDDSQFPNSL